MTASDGVSGVTIRALRRITAMHPSQWQGVLTTGETIYIRYKWGELTVRIGAPTATIEDLLDGEPHFDRHVAHHHEPMIELEDVLKATGMRLAAEMRA